MSAHVSNASIREIEFTGNATMTKIRYWIWAVWFVILTVLPYTSIVAPERVERIPLLFSVPRDLVLWLALGALYVVSIWLFAVKGWKNDE